MDDKLIFERSKKGRRGVVPPPVNVPRQDLSRWIPKHLLRETPPELPEVSEPALTRHYVWLSHKNMSIDTAFYPLGSCTMKYNPKINEKCAALPAFAALNPHQPVETIQGMLALMHELQRCLCIISGMDAITLQPAAGAQGEFTGLMSIGAYHRDRKDFERTEVLIPDSAHGTNPATCTLSGFKTVQIQSDKRGRVDLEALKKKVGPKTAAMMITNPSTLGLFETNIVEISEIIHKNGGLMYMDGANMNALVGVARPADFGIDVMHFNLHKTFSTPHGGGGPGSGPVAVKKILEPYLPVPRVACKDGVYSFDTDWPKSIGKVKAFFGNVGMLVRAYVYIRFHGAEGLRRNTENAVLNANYLMSKLKGKYFLPYKFSCMHEFVLSADRQKKKGVRALDIAKRLLDFNFHAPTIYFPLIVHEAMMIEPTETENKETLDAFADVMIQIAREADEDPQKILTAPHTMSVKRLDEVKAAKEPILCHCG